MSVATYTKSGTKATTAAKLDKNVFGVAPTNHELLKQAYDAYLANGRENFAVVKTRGEVRGGGKKPWKQKGTGRARFGSSRNPIWRGGGITFGPTGNENYTKKMPLTAKRAAIRQALSMAAAENRVAVIENFVSKEGKTKDVVALLDKVGAHMRTLVVVDTKDALVERATSNLQSIKLVQAIYLNVFDIVNADTILLTSPALGAITDWLSAKKAVKV